MKESYHNLLWILKNSRNKIVEGRVWYKNHTLNLRIKKYYSEQVVESFILCSSSLCKMVSSVSPTLIVTVGL